LFLLGIALLDLVLLDNVGASVVYLLSDPLLFEVLLFRVVLLVHRGNLLGVLLFAGDLMLMVVGVRAFDCIQLFIGPGSAWPGACAVRASSCGL